MITVSEILTERSKDGMNPQVFFRHIDHVFLRIIQYIVEITTSMVGSKIRYGVRETTDPFEGEKT